MDAGGVRPQQDVGAVGADAEGPRGPAAEQSVAGVLLGGEPGPEGAGSPQQEWNIALSGGARGAGADAGQGEGDGPVQGLGGGDLEIVGE